MFLYHFLFACPPPASLFLIHAAKVLDISKSCNPYLLVFLFVLNNKKSRRTPISRYCVPF